MEIKQITDDDVRNVLTSLFKECHSENPNFKSILAKAFTLGEHVGTYKIKEKINNIFKDNGK